LPPQTLKLLTAEEAPPKMWDFLVLESG